MGWTKKQLIEEAFDELALAGHVFDLTPEELQAAGRRLDAMLAMWNGKGICLGYALSSGPDSDLDADSGLPDFAVEPAYMNLAQRLAAGYGKAILPTTAAAAKDGYDMLVARAAMPSEVQFPGSLPRGAGNKPWRWERGPFMQPPVDPLTPGPADGEIEFN
ncbi:MAG: packaged DNA stabilization gp4 family protein [Bacillota bacterium]